MISFSNPLLFSLLKLLPYNCFRLSTIIASLLFNYSSNALYGWKFMYLGSDTSKLNNMSNSRIPIDHMSLRREFDLLFVNSISGLYSNILSCFSFYVNGLDVDLTTFMKIRPYLLYNMLYVLSLLCAIFLSCISCSPDNTCLK